jgi:putative iron-dependent peroxidase
VHRPRSSADAWSALLALGDPQLPEGASLLVGLRDDLARTWLDVPDLPAARTLPRTGTSGYRFPSTQGGVLLQVCADERAVLTTALRRLDALLAPFCWKDEEIAGGWDAERREPFGFRERAASNPEAADRVTIASGPGAGGTWLLYLRFEAERARFLVHPPRERERIVGATLEGVPLAHAPDDAHVRRAHAHAATLLRRGFPYRSGGAEGLAFVAAASSPLVFDEALDSLLGARGTTDRLLGYAPAISGGVYYVSPRLPGPKVR